MRSPLDRLADLCARIPRAAVILVVVATLGLVAEEVVPHYQVERHAEPGLLDFPTYLYGDCPYYRTAAISVLKDGDLDLKNNLASGQFPASGNVAQGKRGAWYPKHAVLMSLLAVPFYAALGDVGLLVFNLLQIVALLVVMWIGARRQASDTIALGVTLWYAFGTLLRPVAYNFAPDVLSTLFVAGGIVALHGLRPRPILAGLLLGFACWSKWTNVIFFAPAGLFLCVERRWYALLRFGVAAAVPVLGLLALDFHMFGSPFVTPYDRVLVDQQGTMVLEPSHRTFFNLPFWSGLWAQMSDHRNGLVISAPPVLLAVPGLALLAWRARPTALLVGGACLLQLAAFAKYDMWWSSSYGHRFLLTVVALSAIPVATLFARLLTPFRRIAARRPTRQDAARETP